jgi:hypothetical protein
VKYSQEVPKSRYELPHIYLTPVMAGAGILTHLRAITCGFTVPPRQPGGSR